MKVVEISFVVQDEDRFGEDMSRVCEVEGFSILHMTGRDMSEEDTELAQDLGILSDV